ncbi:MAG: ABC transporter ATP-binding protein, partial [Rhodospirillaceae bacterium]|nr:ABC transporter ATP-binding protein [Rhodospirillaceae bacterium]
GGQRQRVALARALVTEPEILLLDEPLSALDAHLVIRMQGVLTRLQRELGITFVYVTHSQSEAFAMANRVIIMDQGKISQIGSAKEIYHAPSNSFVAQFVGRNNILTGKLQISNGSVYAITSLGRFTLPREIETRAPGSDIAFVIGADRVNLSTEQPTNDNYLSCQLISEEFVGSVVTLFLEAADGTEIKAQIQQRELDAINPQPGMNLWARWLTAHAHVLPPIN